MEQSSKSIIYNLIREKDAFSQNIEMLNSTEEFFVYNVICNIIYKNIKNIIENRNYNDIKIKSDLIRFILLFMNSLKSTFALKSMTTLYKSYTFKNFIDLIGYGINSGEEEESEEEESEEEESEEEEVEEDKDEDIKFISGNLTKIEEKDNKRIYVKFVVESIDALYYYNIVKKQSEVLLFPFEINVDNISSLDVDGNVNLLYSSMRDENIETTLENMDKNPKNYNSLIYLKPKSIPENISRFIPSLQNLYAFLFALENYNIYIDDYNMYDYNIEINDINIERQIYSIWNTLYVVKGGISIIKLNEKRKENLNFLNGTKENPDNILSRNDMKYIFYTNVELVKRSGRILPKGSKIVSMRLGENTQNITDILKREHIIDLDLYKDKTLETIFEIISHSKNIVKKLLKYIFEEVIWYINSIIYRKPIVIDSMINIPLFKFISSNSVNILEMLLDSVSFSKIGELNSNNYIIVKFLHDFYEWYQNFKSTTVCSSNLERECYNEDDFYGERFDKFDNDEIIEVEGNGVKYCYTLHDLYVLTEKGKNKLTIIKNPYTGILFSEKTEKEYDDIIETYISLYAVDELFGLIFKPIDKSLFDIFMLYSNIKLINSIDFSLQLLNYIRCDSHKLNLFTNEIAKIFIENNYNDDYEFQEIIEAISRWDIIDEEFGEYVGDIEIPETIEKAKYLLFKTIVKWYKDTNSISIFDTFDII